MNKFNNTWEFIEHFCLKFYQKNIITCNSNAYFEISLKIKVKLLLFILSVLT